MQEAPKKLRTEFVPRMNQKVVFLEARVEAKANKIHQGTISILEELKSTVATDHESQERMWWGIKGMSEKTQELV